MQDGVFPGAVLAVRRAGGPPDIACAGRLSLSLSAPVVQPSTVYDLASLTKPLATVTGLALLIQEGRCSLSDQAESLLPSLAGSPAGSATLRDLLTHSSGLPGWRGYYERVSPTGVLPDSDAARREVQARVLALLSNEALIYPRGTRSLYSDLGFLLLGFVIEHLSGLPLNRFFETRVAVPLGVRWPRYIPVESHAEVLQELAEEGGGVAPTEEDVWRGRLLCGEVHDENAAALGGVAGHAGLFGTAESVLAVSGAWLGAVAGRSSRLQTALAGAFTARTAHVPGSSWALGWDTPSPPSSAGPLASARSFGHLGFTGTSLWIDPERELEVVLLSNRVHPTRKNDRIRTFRPVVHEMIWREYAAAG